MKKVLLIISAVLLLIPSEGYTQQKTDPLNQDEELGKVSWLRDYDQAIAEAKKLGKPILILFQEVPGCATCRNYGHNVLSNPLMTEAIENEFVPLAIFNNKKGKDLAILKKYSEPTWNNPVVRIVDSNGDNLVDRVASDYSAKGLYKAMVNALEKCDSKIPEYVRILGEELNSVNRTNIKEAHYKMYCFWTGEKQLGSQNGVIDTKAGFMNGEVVKVTYNSEKISKEQLNSFASSNQMKPIKNNGNFRWSERDEDYYLQHTPLKYVPLSPIQRTKVNSAIGFKGNPLRYLSPKQRKYLLKIQDSNNKPKLSKDFMAAWDAMIASL